MSRMLLTVVRLNLRRLRIDGAAPWVLGAVVLVVAFVGAAAPRFLNSVSDEALRTAVSAALPRSRNIIVEHGLRIPDRPNDPLAAVAERGVTLSAQLPVALAAVVDDPLYVVDSQTFDVAKLPEDPGDPPARRLSFRYQQAIEDRIRLLDGTLPGPAAPIEVRLVEGADPVELPRVQVAITPRTSDLMQLTVGDRAILTPQPGDALTIGVPSSQLAYQLVVEISGIIEVIEPDAEYWMSDRSLHQPSLDADAANPDAVIVSGTGLLGPADYGRMLSLTRSALWNYGWRFFVDPARFNSGDVEAIAAGIQELQLQLGSPALARVDDVRLTTGLPRIFDRYLGQRRLTVSILSLGLAGLLALALAVVTLLGALTALRRAGATALARGRGGSFAQLASAQLLEGLILLTPFAAFGYLTARVLVDGREPAFVLPMMGVGIVGVAGLTVAPAVSHMRGDLGRLLDGETPDGRRRSRRIVVEATLAVAAVAALIVFRQRGLRSGRLGDALGGFDPLLAAVPVLLALALGVLLLRLYPVLVRAAGWLGRRRRDVVAFVGFRRLNRQSFSARLPLPVTLLAVGIAIFGALLIESITDNRDTYTWDEVGADYALVPLRTGAPLSASIDLSDIPAIEASADSATIQVRIGAPGGGTSRIPLVALDTAGYQAVTAGTRADARFPESILLPVIGTDEPIPAIVSSILPGAGSTLGQLLEVEGPRQTRIPILVRELRADFPGFNPGDPFIIVPRPSLEAIGPALDLRPTRRYLRAPPGAGPAIAEAVRRQSGGTLVVSRLELLDELSGGPLVKAVDRGYQATVGLAAAFAGLAALAAIALTSRERARDLGFLRTMGLSSRQLIALTVIEQVPWALLATGSGVAFAFSLIWVIQPGLDLSPFTGADTADQIFADWPTVLAVTAAVLVVLLAATALYSYQARRLNLGNVLKLGDHG
jgi:putative ABC transport system permease protein